MCHHFHAQGPLASLRNDKQSTVFLVTCTICNYVFSLPEGLLEWFSSKQLGEDREGKWCDKQRAGAIIYNLEIKNCVFLPSRNT